MLAAASSTYSTICRGNGASSRKTSSAYSCHPQWHARTIDALQFYLDQAAIRCSAEQVQPEILHLRQFYIQRTLVTSARVTNRMACAAGNQQQRF